MNQPSFFLIVAMLSLCSGCKEDDLTDLPEQNIYEINENRAFQDFLTPNYYNTTEINLREDINKFIHFARRIGYQNPFQNASGEITSYSTNREFGVGIGTGGT